MKTIKLLAWIFLLSLISCVEGYEVDNPDPAKDSFAITEKTSEFGWKLFQEKVKESGDQNVLISPLSIQVALSMALNGANGKTLSEMRSTLGFEDWKVSDINLQTAGLRALMEDEDQKASLITANGFFYDPNRVIILNSFIEPLVNQYRAGFLELNFEDPSTIPAINDWIKENTNGKINDLLKEIKKEDIAFLINALAFKADWAKGFDPEWTKIGPFITNQGTEIQVEFVSGEQDFSVAKTDDFLMVDLPFVDSTFSLSLIKPQGETFHQINWVSLISAKDLWDMWFNLTTQNTVLEFPKLDLTDESPLEETLQHLGMVEAFSPDSADFSKMGQSRIGKNIYIRKVSHKALLKIDEGGAEGAAAAVVVFSSETSYNSIRFDHPFVIVLRHIPSQAILFAGLVNDPS
jgi:serpin B